MRQVWWNWSSFGEDKNMKLTTTTMNPMTDNRQIVIIKLTRVFGSGELKCKIYTAYFEIEVGFIWWATSS